MVIIGAINLPAPGALFYSTNNIKLKIADKLLENGTVYISPDALAWKPENSDEGISIQWKQISVHGVSSNPIKCIYFMLDHKLFWRGVYEGPQAAAAAENRANGQHNGAAGDAAAAHYEQMEAQDDDGEEDEGNETDDEENELTECWLIPADINSVDAMFEKMVECQALHPDSDDSFSEESDYMDDDGGLGGDDAAAEDDNGFGNNDEDGAGDAQGGMQNLNINEQFEDADE